MIRVLALCRYDRNGSSSRLRYLQYIPHLAARGVEVTPAPFFDDRYIKRLNDDANKRPDHIAGYYIRRLTRLLTARRYDILWIEKEVLPWIPASFEGLFLRKIPYILDLDDAWFARYESHSARIVRLALGNKLERLAGGAAAVFAGNDYLVNWAHDVGARRVVPLPTVIDLDRYPPNPLPRRKEFTIGWIGQPSTTRYLEIVTDALRELCRQPGTKLRLVGAGKIDLPGIRFESRPWEENNEVADLAGVDVGIMPLGRGTWERGKCGYKLIQYMAASRPVVASDTGVGPHIVQEGMTGFLVGNTKDQWVGSLDLLRRDRDLAQRMGMEGRTTVESRFSLESHADLVAETLTSVASSPPEPPLLKPHPTEL